MEIFKDSLYKIVGQRIKQRRLNLSISQAQLSENLGISRASVSNIEVGRHQVTLANLYDVSKFLKVDICDLLPKFDEVIIFKDSKVLDLTSHVDKEKFNYKSIKSISELINNLDNGKSKD